GRDQGRVRAGLLADRKDRTGERGRGGKKIESAGFGLPRGDPPQPLPGYYLGRNRIPGNPGIARPAVQIIQTRRNTPARDRQPEYEGMGESRAPGPDRRCRFARYDARAGFY